MPTRQERTALAFLVALAITAAGVRAVGVHRFEAEAGRADSAGPADGLLAARALAAQQEAVDSASRNTKRRATGKRNTTSSRSRNAPKLPVRQEITPIRPVDVNRATVEELERLPRVGPALAKRIVDWRERHGPFRGPDDLRHVRGIGPSTVRLLDSLVTFSGGHRPLDSEGSPSLAYHFRSVF